MMQQTNEILPCDAGAIASKKGIRFMHIRRPCWQFKGGKIRKFNSEFGGITIAYCSSGKSQYKCAMARCNLKDKDRYSKEKGRQQALERLIEDDDVWTLDLAHNAEIFEQVVELVLNFKEFRRALRPEVRVYE